MPEMRVTDEAGPRHTRDRQPTRAAYVLLRALWHSPIHRRRCPQDRHPQRQCRNSTLVTLSPTYPPVCTRAMRRGVPTKLSGSCQARRASHHIELGAPLRGTSASLRNRSWQVNEPETRGPRYEDAMLHYRELAKGVRMIREAVEQTFGAGLLPTGEHAGARRSRSARPSRGRSMPLAHGLQ